MIDIIALLTDALGYTVAVRNGEIFLEPADAGS